ncbi:reverse gyrase, partial [Corchorus capsularis]
MVGRAITELIGIMGKRLELAKERRKSIRILGMIWGFLKFGELRKVRPQTKNVPDGPATGQEIPGIGSGVLGLGIGDNAHVLREEVAASPNIIQNRLKCQ